MRRGRKKKLKRGHPFLRTVICIAVLFVMWKIAAGAAGDGYGPAAGDSGPGLTVHGEAEPEAGSPVSGGQTSGDQNSGAEGSEGPASGAGSFADYEPDAFPAYAGEPYVTVNGDVPYFSEEELTAAPFEEYGPLDELGRCTGAAACAGPETLPTAEREDVRSVRPSGYHNKKYSWIEGGYLYNRCHLIGYLLTGQNANERNLITGTRYLNIEGMKPFEDSVAQYIYGTRNHVLYRVTPVYEGADPVASGVLMEARSVEDPRVMFCVYCYNVQPGVVIDYTTGWSRAAD